SEPGPPKLVARVHVCAAAIPPIPKQIDTARRSGLFAIRRVAFVMTVSPILVEQRTHHHQRPVPHIFAVRTFRPLGARTHERIRKCTLKPSRMHSHFLDALSSYSYLDAFAREWVTEADEDPGRSDGSVERWRIQRKHRAIPARKTGERPGQHDWGFSVRPGRMSRCKNLRLVFVSNQRVRLQGNCPARRGAPWDKMQLDRRPSMKRIFHFRASSAELGPLEERLLDALWIRGNATVRELIDERCQDLAYTTVMTTLDRLFKKKLLSREAEGRAFRYAPLVTREQLHREAATEAFRQLLEASPAPSLPLSYLVEMVSERHAELLDQLSELVEAKRKELRRRHSRAEMADNSARSKDRG